MFLATRVDFEAELLEPLGNLRLQDLADVDFGDAHMAVRVALDALQLGQVVFADVQDDSFADDRNAVAAAVAHALDDGADQRVDEHLEPQRSGELFGNQRQRGARGLGDAEAQVPRGASHRDHDVPPRGRLRIDHQVLDDLDAVVTRGLEAERVDVRRQIEIVVDGLRHVHDAEAAGRMLGELHRREGRVVAADGDELRDVEPQQRLHRVLEQRRALRRVGAGDADVRTAAKVNAADPFDRERGDVLDVPLHDPFESVAQADDLDSLQPGPDRRRRYDAV